MQATTSSIGNPETVPHKQSVFYKNPDDEVADMGVLPCDSCKCSYNTEIYDYCPRCGWQTINDF